MMKATSRQKKFTLAAMLKDRYEIETSSDIQTFEFISIGRKGSIIKVIRYTEINVKGFYNLGFGDKDPQTGYVSDLTVTKQ